MYYGAQYFRPPFPEKKDWERDFKNMKNYGFNCVKLWAVWNYIEKEKGVFEFRDLDEFVCLAKEYKLDVIINLIPEGAPYWTYNGHDEDLYETADGQKIRYGGPANIPSGGWPGLCMDSPNYAHLVSNFIEKTAAHFAEEKAIIAIDVWNEPHLEPMYDYRSNMLCYCKHTQQEFRAWLRAKYESLEHLNAAWYRTYTNWEQVSPPPRFGTWADMLDWRKFWLDNMRRWLRIRVEASRKGAPNIPVQTHVAYSGILGNRIVGGLANELGDEFGLAREVDIFGLSSFPKWLMGEEHKYRHFIHNELVACASKNKPFYQVELQGGGGKPGLLGGEVPTADDICVWNWNTIAAGGKGSVYWQYAVEPAGIESPGFGLVGFKGEETKRSEMAGICAKELNIDSLEDAVREPILNAIYVSRSSDLLCFAADRKEEMYAGGLSGIFKAAYEKGVAVTFLHEDDIDTLQFPQIQSLYLPMLLVLSKFEIKKIKNYVESGGTVVSEACPGLYKPDGLLDQDGIALEEIFGLEHNEIQAVKENERIKIKMHEPNTNILGCFYRQIVNVIDESIKVHGVFEDGQIAVTERALGRGRAIWIGTYPSYYYEHTPGNQNQEVLLQWFHKTGYEEIESIEMEYEQNNAYVTAPVIRMLRSKDKRILVAVNHCNSKSQLSVHMKNGEVHQIDLHANRGELR